MTSTMTSKKQHGQPNALRGRAIGHSSASWTKHSSPLPSRPRTNTNAKGDAGSKPENWTIANVEPRGHAEGFDVSVDQFPRLHEKFLKLQRAECARAQHTRQQHDYVACCIIETAKMLSS
eukprot:806311-Pleurochrysis_carterae.AAC.1